MALTEPRTLFFFPVHLAGVLFPGSHPVSTQTAKSVLREAVSVAIFFSPYCLFLYFEKSSSFVRDPEREIHYIL